MTYDYECECGVRETRAGVAVDDRDRQKCAACGAVMARPFTFSAAQVRIPVYMMAGIGAERSYFEPRTEEEKRVWDKRGIERANGSCR